MTSGGHNKRPDLKAVKAPAELVEPDGLDDTITEPLKAPDWLSPYGKDFWDTHVEDLIRLGLLTGSDVDAFTVLCETFATIKEARLTLQKEGLTIGFKGSLKKHPSVTTLNQATGSFRQLASDFGLTPLSRGRLGVGDIEKDLEMKKWDEFLFGRNR
jgi:P27 family predicted phage terminase small subunit